jgi:hypothetical protein
MTVDNTFHGGFAKTTLHADIGNGAINQVA